MSVATMIRREHAAAIARRSLFRDRLLAAAGAGLALSGCMAAWDWRGWDRLSVAGSWEFTRVSGVLVLSHLVCLAFAYPMEVSRVIAGERDRKGLDAVLTTRLSSAEIVLGLIAVGFLRFLNAAAATTPVVALIISMGGLDPRWIPLGALGLSTTAIFSASVGVAASIRAPTANRAAGVAATFAFVWLFLPVVLILLRATFLPLLPGWLMGGLLWVMDSSPTGLALGLLGATPRPWGLLHGTIRMAAIQVAGAAILAAWSSWRLRPASRAIHDLDVRRVIRRALRRASSDGRPCGDDPVFWNETRAYRIRSRVGRIAWFATTLASVSILATFLWYFAAPAFAELWTHGYGASGARVRPPELNPLIRFLVARLTSELPLAPEPGLARFEFNLALRQIGALLAMMLSATMIACGAESISKERQRDTWPGLLATPLTGGEIARGKTLGVFWRSRGVLLALVAMWALGLAAGALHPLGVLAATAWLAASLWLLATMGIRSGLNLGDPERVLRPMTWPATFLLGVLLGLLMTAMPAAMIVGCLFGYDDVAAAARSGVLPMASRASFRDWIGARTVAGACLLAILACAAGAWIATRSLAARFDRLVGRPCRPSRPRSGDPFPVEMPGEPGLAPLG